MLRTLHRAKERGAALVEFALISPFLFLILFGIIDFGWMFTQVIDTRHGTREAARLAAVNYQPTADVGLTQTDLIVAEVCARLEDPTVSRVTLTVDGTDRSTGGTATVRVERDLEQLTGFFAPMLDGNTPSSEVKFRLERTITWDDTSGQQACP
ncbi:MAG: Flp pilus assembly protein TadG [Acidimicrobiales bacterium]|jgi:Flp pilus assembly protein TadG